MFEVLLPFFNRIREMGEKHLAVYNARLLSREISDINRRGK
jgi:hypothetical protein